MTKYTLYTEFEDTAAVKRVQTILGDYFDGYTLHSATGVWKGIEEIAGVITIITEQENEGWIREAARRIKAINRQESILVIREAITLIDTEA